MVGGDGQKPEGICAGSLSCQSHVLSCCAAASTTSPLSSLPSMRSLWLWGTGPFPQSLQFYLHSIACARPCYFRIGTICVSPPEYWQFVSSIILVRLARDYSVLQIFSKNKRVAFWMLLFLAFRLSSFCPVLIFFSFIFSSFARVWRWLLRLPAAGLLHLSIMSFHCCRVPLSSALAYRSDQPTSFMFISPHSVYFKRLLRRAKEDIGLLDDGSAALTKACWLMVWLEDGSAVLTVACWPMVWLDSLVLLPPHQGESYL